MAEGGAAFAEAERLSGRIQGKKNGVMIHTGLAAEMLGCCDMTVRRLCMAGALRGFRLNDEGWFQIELASVQRFKRDRIRANFSGAKEARRR
ncbi:MAG: hypothetical protein WCC59_15075 [Terriglobales bacterium]